MANKLELQVAEALQNDVGRGIVRLSSASSQRLGVTSGDIVKIKGGRETAAIVWQAHPQDEGLNIIRMDGLIRQNSKSSLGERVHVSKVEPKEAKKVVIAPTQEIRFSGDFERFVKQRLEGRPLFRGDNIMVGVLGTTITFVISTTNPDGVVQLTNGTNLEIRTKPVAAAVTGEIVRYEDIGGLKDEVTRVREMIELPMKHPELFEKLGIKPPKFAHLPIPKIFNLDSHSSRINTCACKISIERFFQPRLNLYYRRRIIDCSIYKFHSIYGLALHHV